MPSRAIPARGDGGAGIITIDHSGPFCPAQNSKELECSKGTAIGRIIGLVKKDPRGSSASLQGEC